MNFRTLDLNLLRVFDTVMAERNLTRAAEQLAMTQPAVSNALKRFRIAVGEDLLTRAAFGVKPTARAETLWPEVREALAQLREALDPQAYDPSRQSHTFQLAMADVTAVLLMPSLIAAIESSKALANLRVLPLTTRDPRSLLEHGEADMALGYFPDVMAALTSQGSDAALSHERLYDSEYVCVMRRGHPLAERPALSLDDFCAAHHLLVSFSGRAHGFVDQALTALQRTRRVVLTVNQFYTAGRVVVHSDLLTVLPRRFIAATGYADQLEARPLPLSVSPVHVAALWHRRRERDPAHRWLRGEVLAAARRAETGAPG